MNPCEEIIANMKMEECYAGLSLVFDGNNETKEVISLCINKVSELFEIKPIIFDNTNNPVKSKPGFYIEFSDENRRDCGEFFAAILKELKIDKCINNSIN